MFARRRLEVEGLGQRILPSVTLGVLPGDGMVAAQLLQQPTHPLAGQGNGTYTGGWPPIPDMGRFATLAGTADLAKLGQVTVVGSVHGPGFILYGNATGTLTLTNDRGSVTVSLEGPRQTGFSPLPEQFIYTVTGGTGAYKNLHDHGTLTLSLQPVPSGGGAQSPVEDGFFTLTLDGGYSPPHAKSGINGIAIIAPLQPVEYPGEKLNDALAGAIISIERNGGGPEIARVTTGSDGTFKLTLPPGTYRLVPLPPKPGSPYPRAGMQTVVVHPGQYTFVTVIYDSGLRYPVPLPADQLSS